VTPFRHSAVLYLQKVRRSVGRSVRISCRHY